MKITILREDNTRVEVLLMRNKEDDTYSFINLTKKHICPCRFESEEKAIKDILSYDKNYGFIIGGVVYTRN